MGEPAVDRLQSVKNQEHCRCFVCGAGHLRGLAMAFRVCGQDRVEGQFERGSEYQGYGGLLHGGIICSLLDGAMTNCLFAAGKAALTAELSVKFKSPVVAAEHVTVQAWIRDDICPLYILEAELLQGGIVKARATGKFMRRD
jgi:acyl-coenzyme A thioesterase PaaI-like protein